MGFRVSLEFARTYFNLKQLVMLRNTVIFKKDRSWFRVVVVDCSILMFTVVDSKTGKGPASMIVNSILSLDGGKQDLEAAC